jgi:hypothetical protein
MAHGPKRTAASTQQQRQAASHISVKQQTWDPARAANDINVTFIQPLV